MVVGMVMAMEEDGERWSVGESGVDQEGERGMWVLRRWRAL